MIVPTVASATNERGFFRLNVTPGNHRVVASMIGFQSIAREIAVDSSSTGLSLFFDLLPSPVELDSVVVVAHRQTPTVWKPEHLAPAELLTMPRFAEPDPVRVIHSLPGVTHATTDFNAQIYVRGGGADETGILLDGVPLFNPYHFAGWISLVHPDIVGSEVLYKSNYPRSTGGFLSGLLEMRTKDANPERWSGIAALALSTVRAAGGGPLGPGTLLVSGRLAYQAAVINTIAGSNEVPFSFFDLYAKYSLQFDNHAIRASLLSSRDSYDVLSSRMGVQVSREPRWSNLLWSVTEEFRLHDGSLLDIHLFSSGSSVLADADNPPLWTQPYVLHVSNSITETGATISITHATSDWSLMGGVDVRRQRFHYAWNIMWSGYNDTEDILLPKPETFFDYAPDTYQFSSGVDLAAGFFQGSWEILPQTRGSIGYRMEYNSLTHTMEHLPSLELSRTTGTGMTIRAAYGRYAQHLFTLKESKTTETFFAPYVVSFPATDKDQVAHADHFTLAVECDQLPAGLTLNVETYYERKSSLASTYENDPDALFREPGKTAGCEVTLRRTAPPFQGWVAYSLSQSVKEGAGYSYPTNADRTHAIKIFTGLQIAEWIGCEFYWTYATGVPYTTIIGKTIVIGSTGLLEWQDIPGNKNSSRVIPYHRLDISLKGNVVWGDVHVRPFIEVFNVYNSPNPFFYNTKKKVQAGSNVVPNIGVEASF